MPPPMPPLQQNDLLSEPGLPNIGAPMTPDKSTCDGSAALCMLPSSSAHHSFAATYRRLECDGRRGHIPFLYRNPHA